MKKILYVTTLSITVNTFLIPHIKELIKNGYEVHIACNGASEVYLDDTTLNIKFFNLPFDRKPIAKGNIQAYKRLKNILNKENYDLVHVHTPIASTITRLAVPSESNTKLIYTAHGFHFYKGAPLFNWLFYFPIEYILSNRTDLLITINNEDFKRAKSFKSKNVVKSHGVGIDLTKYKRKQQLDKLQKQLMVHKTDFVILSIGELNSNKNHQLVIRALSHFPNINFKYLICGEGHERAKLLKIIKELGLEKKIKLLGYRDDIDDILSLSDLFIFPSLREGLPVSVMEAMASGVPIIASDIRGNNDLVENYENGMLFTSNNISDLIEKLEIAFENTRDLDKFSIQGKKYIQKFSLQQVLEEMLEFYSHILDNS